MVREMGASHWLMWSIYMELSPSGEELESLRAASIACAIWNVQIAKAQGSWDAAAKRGEAKGERPVFRDMHEFMIVVGDMPDHSKPKRRLSPKMQFESVVSSFESLGFQPVVKEGSSQP